MSGISNQLFGMVLLTLTFFVMLSVTVLLLDPADAATAAVLTIVLSGATFVVWRFDALWTIALGLLVSIGATLTVFYLAFGIFQVFSPIEFIAGLLLVVGFFFATIGGVAALVRHRRGSEPGGTRLRQSVLVFLGVSALVSVGGFLATRTTVEPSVAAGAVLVEMQDFMFDPSAVAVPVGERLIIRNTDAFAHDFTLEEYGLYAHVGPGSEAVIDVSNLTPGSYDYVCSLHSFAGEGMTGIVTIRP